MTTTVQEIEQFDIRTLIRHYTYAREAAMADRIRVGNAIDAVGRGVSIMPDSALRAFQREYKDRLEREENYEALIRDLVKEHPLAPYIKNVKGVSTINCAPLLAELDPHKAPYASSFQVYCGYGVRDYWAVLSEKYAGIYTYEDCENQPQLGYLIPLQWAELGVSLGYDIIYTDDVTKEFIHDIINHGDSVGEDMRAYAPPRFLVRLDPIDVAWIMRGKFKVVAPQAGYRFREVKGESQKYWATAKPKKDWFLVRASDRNISGWVSPFNYRMKPACFRIHSQFIRMGARSPYQQLYTRSRAKYIAAGYENGHSHYAAIRRTMKVFLQHLWVTWRQIEGLPTTMPWPIEKMGHTTYYAPEDFGWYTD